jgi:hypothetical protein
METDKNKEEVVVTQNKKPKHAKNPGLEFIETFFGLVIVIILTVLVVVKISQPSDPEPEPVVVTEVKQSAQKQLDDKMNLLIEKGMVTSYSFSSKDNSSVENVIYVSNLWYNTPATLKKDILSSLAGLKEQARGSHRFEVRDANSNEKLGEVTAFSGEIKIYK